MALTSSSFQDAPQPPRSPADNAAAQAVYGNPARPDATREPRMQGISDVAAAHTSSNSGESAIDAGFLSGDHQWTKSAGVRDAGASVPGTPGFPGDTNWPVG